MPAKPSICLVSPARNEGPYLLEWIAWHRMIGFDDIIVLTHDCTDGSDVLLDLSALSREVAFAAEYVKLLAVPAVERLHHTCCTNYVAQLCQHAGVAPKSDARYLHHIALSQ